MDTGELTRRVRALEKEHTNREIPGVDQAGVVLFDVPEKLQTSLVNKDSSEVKTSAVRNIYDNQKRSDERRILYEQVQSLPSGDSGSAIRVREYIAKPGTTDFLEITRKESTSSGVTTFAVQAAVIPIGSNKFSLGLAGAKWSEVYASNGSINTSDERYKTGVESIPDAVLDAWGNVGFVQFQMADAVAVKGGSARLHTGLIAQRIKAVFDAAGIDAFRYGLLCYDAWKETSQLVDQNGDVVEQAHPAGDVYSLRYDECLCMEAAYQRRRADRLEARIAALEAKLK